MWRAFVYSNEVPADRVKQAYDEFMPLDGTFRDERAGPGEERAARLPAARAVPPAVRRHAEDAAGAGAPDHQGVPRPGHAPRLPRPAVRGGARRGHLRAGRGLDRGEGDRRLAGPATRAPGSPASPTSAPTATGPARTSTRRTGTPSAAWPGITRSPSADDRRRVDPDDVHQRRGRGRAGSRDDARVARGGGELHDAARPRAHHGRRAPLRAGPVGRRAGAPTGRPSTTIAPTRSASASTARRTGSNARGAVLPAGPRAASPAATRCPTPCCCGSITCGWTERLRSGRTLWDELVHRYRRRRRLGARDARAPGTRWRARSTPRASARSGRSSRSRSRRRRGGATPPLAYFQTFSRLPIPAGYAPPAHPLEFYQRLRCPADPPQTPMPRHPGAHDADLHSRRTHHDDAKQSIASDALTPRPEHHFTFGLWTVGNPGRDPFGEPVRPCSCARAHRARSWRSSAPTASTCTTTTWCRATPRRPSATGSCGSSRRRWRETGMRVPMATTNLFGDPVFRDGAFTSNDARVRALRPPEDDGAPSTSAWSWAPRRTSSGAGARASRPTPPRTRARRSAGSARR